MKIKTIIQRPRGTKDLFKEEAELLLFLEKKIIEHSDLYFFNYIQTPTIEEEKVFTSSLGNVSDVIEKEMFYIKEKEGDSKYVLKPEGTASIARAYIQNGFHSLPQPVRLFYVDKMYRREKPQSGRYREHHQWGLEIIGSEDPINDAEIILVFDRFLKKFKLKDYVFKINSIGCQKDRKKYISELRKYYRKYQKKLCNDCQRRYKLNPLRLLDCKQDNDQKYKNDAPILINYLCKDCENHFNKILEYLEALEINFEIEPKLVRGFDYYNRTVFELFFLESSLAIGGGGRYDNLIKILGWKQAPAVGGAIGLERLAEVFKIHNIKTGMFKEEKIFIAPTTEKTKEYALIIYDKLTRAGIKVATNFSKTSLSSQLELANKLRVKYCIIAGHQELGNKTVILKNMDTKTQEFIHIDDLVLEIKKRLKI